jgi:uncharacterized protein
MKVLITGGSGFIGKYLTGALVGAGHQVTIVTRDPSRVRTARAGVDVAAWLPDLAPYDGVVHLAGEPIFGRRWSAEQKERIRASRATGTRKLVSALKETERRPRVLVSGSAIGFYGDRGEELLTEDSPPGDDFLAGVCIEWEREALAAVELGVRTVLVRTGVVLGSEGGALRQLLPPFKLGLGGPIGLGRHWMSWIHIRDHAALILDALTEGRLSGPVNAVAPNPVRNKDFTRALGKALRRPALFPVPPLMLKLAFGGVAEVLTASQRCSSAKAEAAGCTFQYGDLESALAHLLPR